MLFLVPSYFVARKAKTSIRSSLSVSDKCSLADDMYAIIRIPIKLLYYSKISLG